MNRDQIAFLHGAHIQYGPLNNRIYLMKAEAEPSLALISEMHRMAEAQGLGKIIVKIPSGSAALFLACGYKREGHIPGFYNGIEDAVFLAKYVREERGNELQPEEYKGILQQVSTKPSESAPKPALEQGFAFHYGKECDAEQISSIYQSVFSTYPFPVHDPAYIAQTMKENVLYYSVRRGGEIVALASAEMDKSGMNVEMTDFATLPEWRGHSLASFLLAKMERDMQKYGMKTAYTIARAMSPGINAAFARRGYAFGGHLINNTNISGSIESMNIWYRSIFNSTSSSMDVRNVVRLSSLL